MENKITDFTDLNAWKEGHKLVIEVYRLTNKFPKTEQFGLVDQMRRCAVSITSNIAEGFSRYSYKEKLQFFRISAGSITELQNQMIISRDVGFVKLDDFEKIFDQCTTTLKIINGLIKSSKKYA